MTLFLLVSDFTAWYNEGTQKEFDWMATGLFHIGLVLIASVVLTFLEGG